MAQKKSNPGSVIQCKHINIGGLQWNIIPGDENTQVEGSCSTPNRHNLKIKLSPHLRPEGEHLDTFMHEILHAMSNMYLTRRNALKEVQVMFLAEAFEDLFVRNPHLTQWIADYADWLRQHKK